ncbi:MAG: Tex-like protein [Deltaproteobacteria bacterium]|nr:Tex-like protein [Deltaproteobacteria bacterium]
MSILENSIILKKIAEEIGVTQRQVTETLSLLEEGGTVPFIARYRKEATGNLDEVQIRDIDESRVYFKELIERLGVILKSIEEQGKLTPELKARIEACYEKTELEDLYLPYKPKGAGRPLSAVQAEEEDQGHRCY